MRNVLLILCAAAAVCAADDSRYKEDFHYSYPQTAGGKLNVESFNGSVEVTGWDQNTVDISGTKHASSQELLSLIKIEVSSSGNMVRVKAVRPENRKGNLGAKFVIRVPRRTELEQVLSSNGPLRVNDIEGNAHLSTSNGPVELARIHGSVDAHSSNGGIHGEDVTGVVEAETSNGGIKIHLRDPQDGRAIRLSTSNGPIELQMDSPRQNDVVATTSNGPIELRLPASARANLHAATNSNGRFHSDFEISMHGELSTHRVDGAIGGGGPKIDLTTSNGSISLTKI